MNLHPPPWGKRALIGLALLAAFSLGVFVSGPAPQDAQEADQPTDTTWTCAMDPQIMQQEPGSCPICGMDLIATSTAGDAPEGAVVLSARARALARLQTATVARQQDAAAELQLLGRVEHDETTRRNVTTWTGGRIDRLHVNATGEQIRRGQIIATLYSPEVYRAHQDLLTAHQQVSRLTQSPDAARLAAQAALEAARERLRLLGVPTAEVEAMATESEPRQAIQIRSSFGGTVIERVATEGAYLETGAPLYRVADLRTLWVQLDAYEQDLPQLAVGQAVSLVLDAVPGETFSGEVSFIDPSIDAIRRTARVRVQVANPDGVLRPGMFAEATVSATSTDAPLVVPASAPLFTGRRSIVYVESPGAQPSYTPRTVRLGSRMGDVYPVVAGLSAGERVVTRGAFALDADLQIRGGPSMMSAPDDVSQPAADLIALSPVQRDTIRPVVEAYLAVQVALAADDHTTAAQAADTLAAAVAGATLDGPAAKAWAPIGAALQKHGRPIAQSADIESARASFEALSFAMEDLLRQLGNPLATDVQVAYCPMALGSAGARWVQQNDTVDNAYFGAVMRRCGEIRSTIAPGTHLAAEAGLTGANTHEGHDH